eukprot:235816_1
MVDMCRISSGRVGYDFYDEEDWDDNEINIENKVDISRDQLISMLKYENKLRLSEEWISKMETEISQNINSPLNGYMTGTVSPTIHKLQTEVVKHFNYKSAQQIDNAIKILRSALATYPNDKEIINSANYIKYNKINKGTFKIGDKMNCDGLTVVSITNDNKIEDDEKKQVDNFDENIINFDSLLNSNINVIISVSVT